MGEIELKPDEEQQQDQPDLAENLDDKRQGAPGKALDGRVGEKLESLGPEGRQAGRAEKDSSHDLTHHLGLADPAGGKSAEAGYADDERQQWQQVQQQHLDIDLRRVHV
jgi:hypothetical protein